MSDVRRLARLYKLSELEELGYGTREFLTRRINKQEIPAVKVGNAYKIFEYDLPKLLQPAGSMTQESLMTTGVTL